MAMRPILQAFAAHCARHDVLHRPRIWATHIDIWGDLKGEIGVPDITIDEEPMATLAVLVPFAIVPTIGSTWLVIDCSTHEQRHLAIVKLVASKEGLGVATWRVPFSMTDDGGMTFGEPLEDRGVPQPYQEPIMDALRSRNGQAFWDDDFDYEGSLQVAEHLLGR